MSGRFAFDTSCAAPVPAAGINSETLARLFDPFFTTKRRSGGSWFGKHILYNLATGVPGGTLQIGRNPRRDGTACVLRKVDRAVESGVILLVPRPILLTSSRKKRTSSSWIE
jgi:hypothetical protein